MDFFAAQVEALKADEDIRQASGGAQGDDVNAKRRAFPDVIGFLPSRASIR